MSTVMNLIIIIIISGRTSGSNITLLASDSCVICDYAHIINFRVITVKIRI